ncbi:hypothetical protein CSB20_03135 [bacterium DOLZORAL124_64_63]|nr:MAG: hypothetical protein CSB20_03135 [bacterium DOLZORAL124_64_63]
MLILTLTMSASLAVGLAWAGAEELTIAVEGGELGGTLLLPEASGPWPVVLILPGSGPTDRDGNQVYPPGKNNHLKQLAEGLAARGVASLRVDKRGAGTSSGTAMGEDNIRLHHFVADAVAWCRLLQADARFSSLTIAGQSQGALVGMAAAWRVDADGLASLSGAGRPFLAVLREQMDALLPVRTRVKGHAILEELEAGRMVPEVPQDMAIILRPSVQEFYISWDRYEPAREMARLACPVLIVQGLLDTQVKEEDARLLHEAKPEAELLLCENLGHLLKPLQNGSPLAAQLALVSENPPFDERVITAVARLTRKAETFHAAREAALDRLEEANRFDEKTAAGQAVAETALSLGRSSGGYLFGLAEGGYAREGAIIPAGGQQDCVSFLYRCTELARARDRRSSLAWALRTRFAGADPAEVVDENGRCDYDHPKHLDYSLDMVRSGNWGRDVTAELKGACADSVGTARYPAGSFSWLPESALAGAGLRAGDILWFVLDPADAKARALREDHGLAIGHVGILDGQGRLVHAASKPLSGIYDEPGVQAVDLGTYLRRVDRYGGVIVTRLR